MIVRTRTIRFGPDRLAEMRRVKLGFEGDNMVERLEFVLPVIADGQAATMMMGGDYANAVPLELSDNGRYAVNLTKEIIGTDGEVEAYIRIDGDGGEVWQSGAMRLVTGELPDVETEIEQRFPTAVETMLAEMEGHRVEMTGTLTEARTAADRAEAAADRAEGASMLGTQYAGQLLYVDSEGRAAPLRIGSGLAIIDGALVITGSVPETGEDIEFVAQTDGSIMIRGVEFIQQDDGSVLFDGAVFIQQDDGSVLIERG